jgi:hypothetical protein
MTEREIFLDALELEDPAAHAAFLDAACAGRPALRQRIEGLLRYYWEDTTFLNVPVMEQLAAVRVDNVVAIYAVSDDGPVPYLVMEYIGGLTPE